MIKLEQQSLVLNAHKVPGPDYRMDQTVKLSEKATATDVINQIQSTLGKISEPQIRNLVINTHGSNGVIHLSYEKIEINGKKKTILHGFIGIQHLAAFSQFKSKIGTIWLTGCQIAGAATGSSETFCKQFAITVGGNVVAADVYQYVNPGYYLRLFPKNCIDEFEGTAYKWDANGNKTEFSRRDWLKF